MIQSNEQMIRTYKRNLSGSAERKFAKEAATLANMGWRVQSQSQSGALGKIFMVTVVYVREVRRNSLMIEQHAFHTEDFYIWGQTAGKAWAAQYRHDLQHIASELQQRVYHLTRDYFPSEIVSVWQQGFRDGATQERT